MRAMRAVAAVVATSAALSARAQEGGDGTDSSNSTLSCSVDEQGKYNWMRNDVGQTPCEVASSLMAACGSDLESFSPPTEETQTDCACSMVTYVLVQACVACRYESDHSASSWYNWRVGCSDATDEGFPHDVSDAVVVPDWAFYDVTQYSAEGNFSVSDAKSIYASDPSQSTLEPSSTATSTASSTPSSVGATSSGPNIGAIVGGVIGGVAAIVIALVALLLWRKRKERCHIAPSAAYMAECGCRALPCPTPQPPSRHYSYTSVAAEKDAVGRHFVRVAFASSLRFFLTF
ncbi:uncharacterized protein SCHCODRAFT_02015531 [Schizophyllum commune H4-8]|uniref:uncharacterized protein n=1 Tax=Schizophyllum commune (strain H4-8 / FGSC 9210) TaxID=578458 RepID=UPI00215DFA63|nr:uncharacterized protein SCHCODRAFT_02015531 [Schizophyllum commune H4-8]KAI5899596.1 hypothetical protein SCHCODRAFT_02015531 [Schizophyllum commune H4-8]